MLQKSDGEQMTVGEMARRLAEASDQYTPNYHARQLRAWTQIGLLEPKGYHGAGRTAAALFDEPQLLTACLLGVMTKIGLTPAQMVEAKQHFRNLDPFPPNQLVKPGLAFIAERLREKERWHLVLHLREDAHLTGGFKLEPKFDNPITEGLKLVSMVFDCRELFRRLLDLGDD